MVEERTIQWYKDSIRNGMRFQVRYAHSNMWPTYKSYYRHEFKDGIIPVNIMFSILRSLVPQVYFRNPSVVITPTQPGIEAELNARLVQDIDRWLLRELMVKNEMKKLITDAFLCGIGTGFVGYDSQYGFSPDLAVNPEGTATLSQFNKSGNRIEYNSQVNAGMPWFLRARPEDTVYPWGCESIRSAEWVAMRTFRPLQDLKADKKYKNTKSLTGSYVQRRTRAEGDTTREDQEGNLVDHEWVELWQIHDAKTKKVIALAMNHPDFLRNEEDHMQVEGLPAETLVFNADPDYIYGISDARIIEPQLLELNEIRTQSMKHRRVDIVKLLYKKDAIAPDDLDRLLSEDVKAAVAVDAEASLRDAVLPLTGGVSQVLADMAQAGEIVRGDVRETVGFSRSSMGEYQGKTHISAAETGVVQQANQIRVDERRDIVADLLTDVMRKFNQVIFSRWTQPMVRSIVGPDGAKYWIKFSADQIRGEYGLKVDPINAVPRNPEVNKQEATQMIKAWSEMNAGMIKQGMPVPAELQRYFFSQYDGIDVDKLLAQQAPQPGAGRNPEQPVDPRMAAQMMQQGGPR